tara:strand:- start:413 stop:703 length:291 start_codon:yes stop_codon:yes gene_type:complete
MNTNKLLLKARKRLMAFRDMFKDNNDINEKNVVGFASFAVMVIFAIADIVTGWTGNPLHVNEFIYNSFLWITLGSFGISEAGKILGKPTPGEEIEE